MGRWILGDLNDFINPDMSSSNFIIELFINDDFNKRMSENLLL